MTIFREFCADDQSFVLNGLMAINTLEKDAETELTVSAEFKTELLLWLDSISNQPASLIIIAVEKAQPIGFILGMVEPQNNNFSIYPLHGLIQAIFVIEGFRRKHIGSALIKEIITAFAEHHVPYCDLSYHPKNSIAKDFWCENGFIPAQITSRKFLKPLP